MGYLIPIVISFASGIAFSALDLPPSNPSALLLIATISTLTVLNYRKNSKFCYLLTIALFFLIGIIRTNYSFPQQPCHIANLVTTKADASIYGTLLKMPSHSGGNTQLIMAVEQYIDARQTLPTTGKVKLTVKGTELIDIIPGEKFLARATLSPITNYQTPGSFDYKKFLENKSIFTRGWLSTSTQIMKVHQLSSESRFTSLYYASERLRLKYRNILDRSLDPETSSLFKALLIGDRGTLQQEVLENFKAAGCIHMLAISGMHIGILAFFFTTTLLWIMKRSTWILLHLPTMKIAAILTIPVLIAYALIAGFNTPVLRALIMSAVFLVAMLFDRQWDLLNNIAIAAFIILILNPLELHTVSFQLSFAAVTAISCIFPRIQKIIHTNKNTAHKANFVQKLQQWTTTSLIVSIAATLGTAPLLIFYFNRFSLISPISTLVVTPLLCFWGLIPGLFALSISSFFPEMTVLLLKFGAIGLHLAERLIAVLASLPLNTLWFSTPSWMEIVSYYLLCASILLWSRRKIAKITFFISLSILILVPLKNQIERRFSSDTIVSFLDVGQGSSAVLELPGGDIFLIDGGGQQTENFNVGESVIAPFLWKKRITSIDGLIITHPHADHFNGLPFIINRFNPQNVWINGERTTDRYYNDLLAIIEHNQSATKIPEPREILYSSRDTTLQCISDFHLRNTESVKKWPNNRSLVLRLSHGNFSFLFPGDIEINEENDLVANHTNLKTDILLAAHHGSATSNSLAFFEKISPKYVITSSGKNQPSKYPAPEVRERLESLGITTFTTAQNGAVSFNAGDDGLIVEKIHDAD
ncbi:MAG: DNA internalization-related competence protein ComEC/Rec2 [Proteobacteria bacterium]|nr:DNA internalization-related competence protein ComEC/Rec2 [Pseudomonadota bacterium]MBU1709814.1 DNA internalization-related competence protein ComEC/Rec2 [Pseudomonadota bacterium]